MRHLDDELAGIGQSIAARLTGNRDPAKKLDARLQRVLDSLTQEDAKLDLGRAAGIACLSETRFSHLFVEEIGLPFRTYVLWLKLSTAVSRIAAGRSLTEAAHHAGFADSAHFSRTFLRMFGLPASLLEMM